MIRTMIVDDQEGVRMGLSLMLRHADGVTVVLEAEDGQQAIDRLAQAEELGRALMDVRIPRMDVIDATARITARWTDVRVLILTTYDEDDYAFGGLSAGASGFLLKDVHAAELARLLRGIPCRINLIPFHQIPNVPLRPLAREKMEHFKNLLEARGYTTTIRTSRGEDISAACGMLSTKEQMARNTSAN